MIACLFTTVLSLLRYRQALCPKMQSACVVESSATCKNSQIVVKLITNEMVTTTSAKSYTANIKRLVKDYQKGLSWLIRCCDLQTTLLDLSDITETM